MSRNTKYPEYGIVVETITGMEIGQNKIIPLPESMNRFRRYLSCISQAKGQKYQTKKIKGELHVMRIKYSNIFSKEIE